MKISKIWRIRPKRKTPEQLKRLRKRYKALRQPITLEQVVAYSARLVHVDYGNDGGCWLFTGKSSSGASRAYARLSHNGCLINASRFALAVKLGCTIWDLDGFDAAHASKAVCMGGRCCRPDHLNRKPREPNRSWDRAKEAGLYGDKVTTRSLEEARKLVAAMYPAGLKAAKSLSDQEWSSFVTGHMLALLQMRPAASSGIVRDIGTQGGRGSQQA